jgi:hypothetical protein
MSRPLLSLSVASILALALSVVFGQTTGPVARIGPEPSDDPCAFMNDYSISHYLELAVEFQKLDPDARGRALLKLAGDRKRGSEVYPLCRTLFQAKDKQEFRQPSIGSFIYIGRGRTEAADWPLAPITIFKGVPILVVHGCLFAGTLGKPADYVSYCLAECRWSDTKFERLEKAKIRELVDEFFRSTPKVYNAEPLADPTKPHDMYDSEWLRLQAE